MRSRFSRLAIALILFVAAAAQADVFRYVDDVGVISYTDTKKDIPASYKDSAEVVTFGDMDYLTIVTAKPGIEIAERLEHLRIINAPRESVEIASEGFTPPFHAVSEMRWLPDNPGDRYRSVDVLYDAKNREITWVVSSIGIDILSGLGIDPSNIQKIIMDK